MKTLALNTAGIIFAVVSLAHWLRVFLKIEVVIGGTAIAMAWSIAAGILTAALAVWMFMAAKSSR